MIHIISNTNDVKYNSFRKICIDSIEPIKKIQTFLNISLGYSNLTRRK